MISLNSSYASITDEEMQKSCFLRGQDPMTFLTCRMLYKLVCVHFLMRSLPLVLPLSVDCIVQCHWFKDNEIRSYRLFCISTPPQVQWYILFLPIEVWIFTTGGLNSELCICYSTGVYHHATDYRTMNFYHCFPLFSLGWDFFSVVARILILCKPDNYVSVEQGHQLLLLGYMFG